MTEILARQTLFAFRTLNSNKVCVNLSETFGLFYTNAVTSYWLHDLGSSPDNGTDYSLFYTSIRLHGVLHQGINVLNFCTATSHLGRVNYDVTTFV